MANKHDRDLLCEAARILGIKGSRRRSGILSAEHRSEIGRLAAQKRWKGHKKKGGVEGGYVQPA